MWGKSGTDWLYNAAILEAFQARAARMAGAVALLVANADNQEAGMCSCSLLVGWLGMLCFR